MIGRAQRTSRRRTNTRNAQTDRRRPKSIRHRETARTAIRTSSGVSQLVRIDLRIALGTSYRIRSGAANSIRSWRKSSNSIVAASRSASSLMYSFTATDASTTERIRVTGVLTPHRFPPWLRHELHDRVRQDRFLSDRSVRETPSPRRRVSSVAKLFRNRARSAGQRDFIRVCDCVFSAILDGGQCSPPHPRVEPS